MKRAAPTSTKAHAAKFAEEETASAKMRALYALGVVKKFLRDFESGALTRVRRHDLPHEVELLENAARALQGARAVWDDKAKESELRHIAELFWIMRCENFPDERVVRWLRKELDSERFGYFELEEEDIKFITDKHSTKNALRVAHWLFLRVVKQRAALDARSAYSAFARQRRKAARAEPVSAEERERRRKPDAIERRQLKAYERHARGLGGKTGG
jgi:hypothetical protein